MITFAIASSAFAFDFNKDNLKTDSDIKAEIITIIDQEISAVTEESIKIKDKGQNPDNEIIKAIKKEMQFTMQQIDRNTKLRKNIFTRSFVEEQKAQKERYQNMIKWGVPTQLYKYIEKNFDLSKVKKIWVVCIYHNETMVEVRFPYLSNHVVVYYNYNNKETPIKHIIS